MKADWTEAALLLSYGVLVGAILTTGFIVEFGSYSPYAGDFSIHLNHIFWARNQVGLLALGPLILSTLLIGRRIARR